MSKIDAVETFNLFSAIVAAIFIEAMPFLVIGALFSAMIEVFVSTERLMRHIPKSTDKGNLGVALHVRRGMAEYVPVPADHYRKSDFVLKLNSKTWAGLYLSALSLTDAIDSGKVQLTGDKGGIKQVFDMFDKFKPSQNYMVPPLED